MPIRLILALLVAALLPEVARAAPPRYAAMLINGTRLEGAKLADWHDVKALPRLDNQTLLEPSNPIRWLRDRTQRLAELPSAYIEFQNGDRLPGAAIDYRSGLDDRFNPAPPHLVVRPAINFEPPENKPVREIRVATQFVRRIVWQRRGRQAYQPGTAFYRDGRSVQFKAVRFHSGEVHLLLADGDRRIDWLDLAELHLPAADPWTAHFDQLALLCPTIDTRLMEIETSTGLVATSSFARLAIRFEGNSAESDKWVHAIQPAWSLDLLWVPFREIVLYRTFHPREVPLSRIAPRQIASRGGLAGSKAAQIDRNIQGGPLRSKTLDFGWGLGAFGGAEITFDLPPLGIRSLRAWVCLDRAAGAGGCIRPRIVANDAKGPAIWEGPVIVGSETVADTGVLALAGPAAGQKAIVLIVDPVAAGRPAGADPLDIRDHANWCDPLLELDPAVVQAEIDKRLPRRFAAWKEWNAAPAGGGTLLEAGIELSLVRDERRPPPGDFSAALQMKAKPLILRRELTIGPADNWLIISAMRPLTRGQEPKLEVRIAGEPIAEFAIPERQADPNDNRPLAVSLAGYQRATPTPVTIEIHQQAAADSAPVLYRAITTASQLPTLQRVFEEQASPAPIGPGQTGSAAVTTEDHYYGAKALKITPGGQFRIDLGRALAIRERPAWGEARFLRFAVRKQTGGRFSLELAGSVPRDPPARYDLGRGEPSYGSATRIWQDNLPKDWIVITRDLYADFGNLDLRSIVVGSPDNGDAFLDHVYLARGPQDFDQIPAAPAVELVNEKARHDLATPIIQRTTPAAVRIEFADGRQIGGVLVTEQGEILTAGHAIVAAGRDCRVALADGRTVAGVTQGVARDFDLGMIRLTEPGSYPRLEPFAPGELPQNQLYLALFHGKKIGERRAAHSEVVQIRRLFRSTVWLDLDATDWLPGGPLLDREGRLIGIQTTPSRFGGVHASRFLEAGPHLARLRNNEIFGVWPPGSEPKLGLEGRIEEGVFHVTAVAEGGPAAKVGIVVGDAIQKIDGKPISAELEPPRAIAERDAGQEALVDLIRAAQPQQVKVVLVPRDP
jgi:S1-C subfamily serine protease